MDVQVPTSICYKQNDVISWGFLSHRQDEGDEEVHDWFKILLDKTEYEKAKRSSPEDVPQSHDDVKKYYRDFVRKLYNHIRKFLEEELPAFGFQEETIQFIFSVPATWSPGVAEDPKQLAKEARFGKGGSSHSVENSRLASLKRRLQPYALSAPRLAGTR